MARITTPRSQSATRVVMSTLLLAGALVVVLVMAHQGPAASSGARAAIRPAATFASLPQAWLSYRTGERGDLSPAHSTYQAWLTYRTAERVDLAPARSTLASLPQTWLSYRTGERADLSLAHGTYQAWLAYRTGERADLAPAGSNGSR
jgi:uncharacterized protein with PQ loop repeat